MGEKVTPIKPDEIESNMAKIIPDFVLDSINELLKENYRGRGSVMLKQKDIISKILKHPDTNLSKQQIYDKHYLDIEGVYSQYGWSVEYDKPSYGDSDFDTFFTFSAQ